MKLLSLFLSIVIGFQFFSTETIRSPLVEIAEVADKQNIEIKSWKVYIKKDKETFTSEREAEIEASKWIERNGTFTWKKKKETDADHYTYTGHKTYGIASEKMILTLYKQGDSFHLLISYEMEGDELTEESLDFMKSHYKKELEKNEVYYSVYGSKDYKEEHSIEEEASMLLHALSAKQVEEMKESEFYSFSAFKEGWEIEVPTNNGEVFNLQAGLRVDRKEGKVNIAIGTPIITSGY